MVVDIIIKKVSHLNDKKNHEINKEFEAPLLIKWAENALRTRYGG